MKGTGMPVLVAEHVLPNGLLLQVRLGDLTAEDTQAIVNAANPYLEHGGGVAGAIVSQGGEAIQAECRRQVELHGPLPTGQVAVSAAGRLKARVIIHAVGPIWEGGSRSEPGLLREAVLNSLLKAEQLALESIAFPAISSGIFGFPKDLCARIFMESVLEFSRKHPGGHLRLIRFTNIDQVTTNLFARELQALASNGS